MEPLNGIVSYDSTALLRQHKQGEGEWAAVAIILKYNCL